MLKSYGWWGGVRWVALVIIVSAQGPNPLFFFFGGTFIRLRGLLEHGLGLGLGPGLYNFENNISCYLDKVDLLRNITYVMFNHSKMSNSNILN